MTMLAPAAKIRPSEWVKKTVGYAQTYVDSRSQMKNALVSVQC